MQPLISEMDATPETAQACAPESGLSRTVGPLRSSHMPTEPENDTTVYQVVLNHEEQYSIWPADRPLPAGWSAEGTKGDKATCLARIKEVWTDMRPKSLRGGG